MFYRRNLPHWQKPDSALFITWRLHGSLPRQALTAELKVSPGKKFLLLDQELDRATYGPTWLKDARLARAVDSALRFGANQLHLYRLSAYVVMSNHVHILIWPKARLNQITKSLKGYTAHECNKLLDRSGEKFWQEESFDHAVRNEEQFYRIQSYIERNPVKAGLVKNSAEWPWSSAGRRTSRTDIPV
jgi:putative transposase